MKRCLVVDDAEIVRKVARAIIESLKYTVVEAANGAEALDACKAEMPDIVFLDWHMPATNSIELIKGIRHMRAAKRPYILYCMTEDDQEILGRAITAGIDDTISKPFDRASITSKFANFALAAA